MAPAGAVELLERQEQLAGGEQRPLDVVAALFVARLDLLAKLLGRRRHALVEDHQGGRRQVVEEGRGAVEEKRQVVLDARRTEAFADVVVHRRVGRLALEALPPALAEGGDRLLVQRKFARRQQPHLLHDAGGDLGFRIEGPDGVDLLVEQVEPEGRLAAHGEEVDERAAHGEIAVLCHLRTGAVTGGLQPAAEALAIEAIAGPQAEAVAGDERQRTHPMHQRVQRGDDHPAAQVGKPRQQRQAIGDDVLVGRELIVGQRLPAREQLHRHVGMAVEEETDLLHQRLGHGGIAGDHQHQGVMPPRGATNRQRAGAAVQATPGVALTRSRQRRLQGAVA